jgi:hypothetical protein
MSIRVVGLDLSLTATGIASNLGWCMTVGAKDITKLPAWDRSDALEALADEILLQAGDPALVLAEQVDTYRAYGGASERAGLFWYVARRLRARGTPFAEVPSGVLKTYALGKGQGKKSAVIDAVARRWPNFETGGDDNMCDATVLAAMGADYLGQPLAAMPATHRKALVKVTWPEVSL